MTSQCLIPLSQYLCTRGSNLINFLQNTFEIKSFCIYQLKESYIVIEDPYTTERMIEFMNSFSLIVSFLLELKTDKDTSVRKFWD